jgi:hypothetical protein
VASSRGVGHRPGACAWAIGQAGSGRPNLGRGQVRSAGLARIVDSASRQKMLDEESWYAATSDEDSALEVALESIAR